MSLLKVLLLVFLKICYVLFCSAYARGVDGIAWVLRFIHPVLQKGLFVMYHVQTHRLFNKEEYHTGTGEEYQEILTNIANDLVSRKILQIQIWIMTEADRFWFDPETDLMAKNLNAMLDLIIPRHERLFSGEIKACYKDAKGLKQVRGKMFTLVINKMYSD